ncbi:MULTISPECIES: DUF1731 domain-containing protein [Cohnella]|uniref:DUF1731 domain-containing protein n=1 Tax=Cohnella TaxID=329857 RepID=UPI0009B93AB2|nr:MULTISPECIES: DUF1731 domain-containing protein [Cohnella]MBN2980060.1 DUF1731 domain-containing protein [Cohnella algarum]
MRFLICGGTGFIGRALAEAMLDRGDEVWIVTRKLPAAPAAGFLYVTWEELSKNPARWNGIDGIVNLAGETINQRWSEDSKRRILISRTQAAMHVADIVKRMPVPPKVVVNASAVAIYGHSYSATSRAKAAYAPVSDDEPSPNPPSRPEPVAETTNGLAAKASEAVSMSAEPYPETGDEPLKAAFGASKAPESEKNLPSAEPLPEEQPAQSVYANGIKGFSRVRPSRIDANEAADAWPGLPSSAEKRKEASPAEAREHPGPAEGHIESGAPNDASAFAPDALSAAEEPAQPADFAQSFIEELFDENSPPEPADYLGRVVVAWEEAADQIPVERLVKLRLGLVLGRKNGSFPLLRLPYRLFAGGRMGAGNQGMPWIHLNDVVSLILFCLDNPDIEGPVNAVAPDPVTNDDFGRILGEITRRPHWLPIPSTLLEAALGERAELVLAGQMAFPLKALEHGFEFAFPRLEDALRDLTAR